MTDHCMMRFRVRVRVRVRVSVRVRVRVRAFLCIHILFQLEFVWSILPEFLSPGVRDASNLAKKRVLV